MYITNPQPDLLASVIYNFPFPATSAIKKNGCSVRWARSTVQLLDVITGTDHVYGMLTFELNVMS